ncbi:MAG TPA: hypothetical protein VMA72_02460 [Streptosporangiaceae bacterium]|nr:hypothetical protein [Streptosporangiaceae bacterium]
MRLLARTTATTAVGAILLVMAGVTATAASAAPASARSWRIAYKADVDGSSFQSMLAISAKDVWALGESNEYGNYNVPVIRRWNGKSWADVRVPARFSHSGPTAIAASSARDVWVFGEYATDNGTRAHVYAIRWNGRSWSAHGLWPTYNTISSAVVRGPGNVWVFGPLGTRHYNGRTWKVYRLPYSITTATADSSSSVWAVGAMDSTGTPVLARWSAGTWTTVPLPSISSAPPGPVLNSVTVADGAVWVAGYTSTSRGALRTLVLRRTGGAWRRLSPPNSALDGIGDLVPDGTGGVWVSSTFTLDNETAAHFTGGRWHVSHLPTGGQIISLNALAHVPHSEIVYVAGLEYPTRLGPAAHGLVERYSR